MSSVRRVIGCAHAVGALDVQCPRGQSCLVAAGLGRSCEPAIRNSSSREVGPHGATADLTHSEAR